MHHRPPRRKAELYHALAHPRSNHDDNLSNLHSLRLLSNSSSCLGSYSGDDAAFTDSLDLLLHPLNKYIISTSSSLIIFSYLISRL